MRLTALVLVQPRSSSNPAALTIFLHDDRRLTIEDSFLSARLVLFSAAPGWSVPAGTLRQRFPHWRNVNSCPQ
jgi:hypothetical protein